MCPVTSQRVVVELALGIDERGFGNGIMDTQRKWASANMSPYAMMNMRRADAGHNAFLAVRVPRMPVVLSMRAAMHENVSPSFYKLDKTNILLRVPKRTGGNWKHIDESSPSLFHFGPP
jgi:hypothetical protein